MDDHKYQGYVGIQDLNVENINQCNILKGKTPCVPQIVPLTY